MTEPSLIVYDGECIYCQNYVRFLRLRSTIGPVELVDARSDDPRVREFWEQGFDLNEGMLFAYRGRVYHGHEAVHILAGLSTGSDMLNRLNAKVFAHKRIAALLYPAMKAGRLLTLLLRGRKLMEQPGNSTRTS